MIYNRIIYDIVHFTVGRENFARFKFRVFCNSRKFIRESLFRESLFRESLFAKVYFAKVYFAKVYSRIEMTGILPLLLLNNEHSDCVHCLAVTWRC